MPHHHVDMEEMDACVDRISVEGKKLSTCSLSGMHEHMWRSGLDSSPGRKKAPVFLLVCSKR